MKSLLKKKSNIRIFLSIVLTILVATGLVAINCIIPRENLRSDFRSFFTASHALKENYNIYDDDNLENMLEKNNMEGKVYPFIYSPFLASIMYPLTLLPPQRAELLWTVGSIATFSFAMGLNVFLIIKLIGKKYLNIAVLTTLLLIFLSPVKSNIELGQVNIFVLFFIELFLYTYLKNKKLLSGAFLGVALLTKTFPILVIIYFFLKKEYRVIKGLVFTLLTGFLLVSSLHGIHPWINFFQTSIGSFSSMQIPGLFVLHNFVNVSIKGTMLRFFSYNVYMKIVLLFVNVSCIGFLIYLAKNIKDKKAFIIYVFFSFVINILINPVAYTQHLIYLYPFLVFILAFILKIRKINISLKMLLLSLTAVTLYDFPTFFYENNLHSSMNLYLRLSYSTNTFFLLVLTTLVFYLFFRKKYVAKMNKAVDIFKTIC